MAKVCEEQTGKKDLPVETRKEETCYYHQRICNFLRDSPFLPGMEIDIWGLLLPPPTKLLLILDALDSFCKFSFFEATRETLASVLAT